MSSKTSTNLIGKYTKALPHQQGACHREVKGGGELYIFAVTLHEVYGMAESLDDGGIIGEGLAERLLVGTAQERSAEGLRCLHLSIGITAYRLAPFGEQMAHRLHHWDHGHHSTMQGGLIVATADDLVRHEGTHTIVHGNKRLGIIDKRQAILHGVEAGSTAIGNMVRHTEVVLTAQLLPIGLMIAWEHENNLYIGVKSMEGVERAHQHGTPLDGDKLLRQFAPHTEAFASSYDDSIFFHKNCIPCLNSLAMSAPQKCSTKVKPSPHAAPGPQAVMMSPSTVTLAAV